MRAVRRAQKKELQVDDGSNSEDEGTTQVNPFDLLENNDANVEDEDDVEIQETPVTTTKKSKKKTKKKKQEEEVDLDAIIAQHQALVKDEVPQFKLSDILSIDVKMLDPNVEMRRLFGRIAADKKHTRPKGRRSVLVPIEDNYPLTIKGGLEMEMLEDIEGIRTFKFVHSKAYQQTQLMFLQCVQSGDPQTMMNLLTRFPFHVDTLLQTSEIFRHQGDHEQSIEMLNRALFAFDRAFHPLFNIASGMVRLPFEHPENRPFYLAIYRYIQSLGRRGCWATAFEFNKVLYAMAPEEDPYAALLSLDFYAVKAKRPDYVERLNACPWDLVLDENYPKPNLKYAQPSTFAEGVKSFPFYIGALFRELKSPGPIQYDAEPKSDFQRLMTDLYVFRSKDIYNTPERIKQLRDDTLPITDFDPVDYPRIPLNICRHILLLDERSLMHYLPRDILNASHLSFDPLPPEDSMPSYLDSHVESSVPQFIQDLLRRIMPGQDNDAVLAALMQEEEF